MGSAGSSPRAQAAVGVWKRRRGRRVLLWGLGLVFGLPAVYALSALAGGAIAVNRDFVEPPEGVEIQLVSNGIHVDFLVPLRSAEKDWSAFLDRRDFPGAGADWKHVLFGWGNRAFYLETPTRADLRLSTAAKALFLPSASVVHVQLLEGLFAEDASCRTLRLGAAAYAELCQHIESSFQRDAQGSVLRVAGRGYGSTDNFYEAAGSYHAFNTCNLWTNRGLKRAGVTTPLWSPFPRAILRQAP
jgi:uncharacterized protein (TIGR02117 family)